MKSKDVFNEVIALGLTPVVFTGRADRLKRALVSFLKNSYTKDQYIVYDRLDATTVKEILPYLHLKDSNLSYVVVDARRATSGSWDKLLKALEDCVPSFNLFFLVDDDAPDTVASRCFKCYVPSAVDGDSDFNGSGAFAVGSWLSSVDDHQREQLLKTAREWTDENTDLLLRELNAQLEGDSILGMPLQRTSERELMYAIRAFTLYRDAPSIAAFVGLRLTG